MNKYLFFILFGIILFLIYNSIETITITIPMIAKNRGSNTCIISQNCVRNHDYNDNEFGPDICNYNCDYLPSYGSCTEYHTNIKKCAQECNLNLNLDSPDKNLNNAGFEKITEFLNTTHQHTQLMIASLNNPHIPINGRYSIETYNSLTFIEYIFRTYLEKIHIGEQFIHKDFEIKKLVIEDSAKEYFKFFKQIMNEDKRKINLFNLISIIQIFFYYIFRRVFLKVFRF